MLDCFASFLCSKLCWHKVGNPAGAEELQYNSDVGARRTIMSGLFIYRFVQCTGERTIGHVVPYLVHPQKTRLATNTVNQSKPATSVVTKCGKTGINQNTIRFVFVSDWLQKLHVCSDWSLHVAPFFRSTGRIVSLEYLFRRLQSP